MKLLKIVVARSWHGRNHVSDTLAGAMQVQCNMGTSGCAAQVSGRGDEGEADGLVVSNSENWPPALQFTQQ